MKAQKVVSVEIFEGEDGNTVIAVVFGVLGRKTEPRTSAWGAETWTRSVFTETNRVEMGWNEGYALRHFRNWTVPAPVVHPAETVAQAVEAAMMAAAGWDDQEDAHTPFPRQFGGSRQRGRLAAAA